MQTRQTWTCVLQLLLLVSSFAVSGCGGTAAGVASAEPVHVHLFCLAGEDGKSVTCEPQARLAHFNSWVKEALYRPHSTFSIWGVGPDRSRSRRFFCACNPEKWQRSVWKAKRDLLAKAREAAGGSRTGLTVPAGCC